MNKTGWLFESLDTFRKFQGSTLDGFGFGPDESDYDLVFSRAGVSVRAYGAGRPGAPVLLIVPAPIKQPYIWDLTPEKSVVRRALEHGFEVYMLEWAEPEGQGAAYGLEDYAGSMLGECIDAIAIRTQADKIFLAGHSLGGIFTALYAAYRPRQVAGLILIEAPLRFGEASGAFSKLIKMDVPAGSVMPSAERIPGSLLGMISASASPQTFFFDRYLDRIACYGSRCDMEMHWRVERWTLDELPLPRRLFEDVAEQLYRANKFMQGELRFGPTRLDPGNITSPLFAVYDPSSAIIPPESILDFYHATASANKELAPYLGDKGVALQHVGVLVGDSAHRDIWPRVFDWMGRVGKR